MNFAATKRLPGFISSPGTRKKFLEPLPLGGGKGLIRLIVTDNWSTGFHAGPRKKTADKGGLLRGEEEQIPRVWIRANDWQRFRSAGHGVPRDAASWVGRRKIYPHTATHTPVHVRHRQPDVSPAQLRLLHPPFVSKQLDAHYGKNHPSRGSFRDDDDDDDSPLTERRGRRILPRRWIFERDHLCFSLGLRLRLGRGDNSMFLHPDCGELFSTVGEYVIGWIFFVVDKGILYFDKLNNEKESFLHQVFIHTKENQLILFCSSIRQTDISIYFQGVIKIEGNFFW